VRAVRSIAQRGVMVVGTAHGSSLGELLRNPELVPLVGGVTAVTLGDEAAKRDNAGSKTRLERAGAPAFSSLLVAKGRWAAGRGWPAGMLAGLLGCCCPGCPALPAHPRLPRSSQVLPAPRRG
jgi:hypothetical protein